MSFCWFCHAVAHIIMIFIIVINQLSTKNQPEERISIFLRACCPSIFSSIAIELNVPCDKFGSIAIELTFVTLRRGF